MPENFAREQAAAAQAQEDRTLDRRVKEVGALDTEATTDATENTTSEKKQTFPTRLAQIKSVLKALDQKTEIESNMRATKLAREQAITRLKVIQTDLAQEVFDAKALLAKSEATDAENKAKVSTATTEAKIDLAKAETALSESNVRVKEATESARIEEQEANALLAEVKTTIAQATEIDQIALARVKTKRAENEHHYKKAEEAVKMIELLGKGSAYAMSLPKHVRDLAEDIFRAAGQDVDFSLQAIQAEEQVYADTVANQEDGILGKQLRKESQVSIENAGTQFADVFKEGSKANVEAIKKNPALMSYIQVAQSEMTKFNVTTGFAADVLSTIISGEDVERAETDSAQQYVQKIIQHVSGLYGAPTSITKSLSDRMKRTLAYRQVRAYDYENPGALDNWNNAANPDGSAADVDFAKDPSKYPKMLTTDKLMTTIIPGMRADIDDLSAGKNDMDIAAIDAEMIAVKSQQYVWANIASTRTFGGLGDATRGAVRTAQGYLSALSVRRKDLAAQANTSRKAAVAAKAMKQRYNANWVYWQQDYKKLSQYNQIDVLFQAVANGTISNADERYIISSMNLDSMTRGKLANRINQIRGNI